MDIDSTEPSDSDQNSVKVILELQWLTIQTSALSVILDVLVMKKTYTH